MARTAACVGLLFAASAAFAAPAGSDPPANHALAVPFHAEDLGVPLLALRGGLQLLQACEVRFHVQCSRNLRESAESGKWTLRYFDTFTLFPERFEKDPAESVASYEAFRELVRETSEAIVLTSRNYDPDMKVKWRAITAEKDASKSR